MDLVENFNKDETIANEDETIPIEAGSEAELLRFVKYTADYANNLPTQGDANCRNAIKKLLLRKCEARLRDDKVCLVCCCEEIVEMRTRKAKKKGSHGGYNYDSYHRRLQSTT